jgi:phosphate transport system substrate-binding protein
MRRTMRYGASFLLAISFLLVSAVSGCSDGELSGTISEGGSTTVYPLAEKLAREFMNEHPKVTVTTDEGGSSGAGIHGVSEGTLDIGAASRELKPDEPALVTHLIGRDGIAIVIHPSNPVANLALAQVKEIFAGTVADWGEIDGDAGKIKVVCREEGSGTRGAFEDMVMEGAAVFDGAILEPSNTRVRSFVSTHPEAIGYLSVGYVDHTVRALSIDGIECTIGTCQSGDYPVVRPLYFLTGEPLEEVSMLVRAFIEISRSARGQDIVAGEGYIPIK